LVVNQADSDSRRVGREGVAIREGQRVKAASRRPPRVRLGIGETVPAGGNLFAQRRFLEAIERRVPQALRELATIARMPSGERVTSMRGRLDLTTEEALLAWAQKWGIPGPDGWWMRQVRNHVQHWREVPSHSGRWQGFVGVYREPKWPALAPWNANEESEADFRTRVDAYVARVRALPGIQPTPVTFTERDFDALALEHVAREPIDRVVQLVDDPNRDSSSTRKRNRQLADLLGLTLRRLPRGRPQKTG
jgi:hypothetical protein